MKTMKKMLDTMPPALAESMEPGEPNEPGEATEPYEDGEPPPTPDDARQSLVHHADSVRYNASHAAAHQMKAKSHATQLLSLLRRMPGFGKHVKQVR